MTKKRPPISQRVQLVTGFLVPTIILIGLSDESRLGPLYAMLFALSLPVAVEIYSFISGRKASYLSIAAIVGIILVGAISLFGLSEEWLAARRAALYIIVGLVILGLMRFKPSLLKKGLNTMIDMEQVEKVSKERESLRYVTKAINRTFISLAAFMLALGVWAYIFTIIFITAPTNTSQFNTEYAELRIVSLFAVTLPLLIGMVAILLSLVHSLEKHTGLEAEALFRKKK